MLNTRDAFFLSAALLPATRKERNKGSKETNIINSFQICSITVKLKLSQIPVTKKGHVEPADWEPGRGQDKARLIVPLSTDVCKWVWAN